MRDKESASWVKGTGSHGVLGEVNGNVQVDASVRERAVGEKGKRRERPDLSKSVDSDILFDITGRTLLLGRVEFCFVTAWNAFPWGEYYWEEFHNKVVNLIDIRQKNHIEYKKNNPDKLPTYTIHRFAWALKASLDIGIFPQQLSLVRWGKTSIEDHMTILMLRKNLYCWMTWAASLRMMNLMHILDKMDVVPQMERKLVEDPSDAAIDREPMDAIGHPDENEGPNEKEDPSDATIDGEHTNAIGHPDENEGPSEKEPSSYVLNTPVDNGDVLMTDAPDTINLADPPSHESKITSPGGSEKKEMD
uniref:Phospholipase-like protein n=1 Tax=Tanacetum cinerariifolium TaxID=118510 RepID=A0A6L2LK76_TANCI|nr:hypothetical protein [Tanacetum cinerariifolium]